MRKRQDIVTRSAEFLKEKIYITLRKAAHLILL